MDSFKAFMNESWFSRKPQSQPQPAAPRNPEQEDQEYQAALAKFKKNVEDFAMDPRSSREALIDRIKGAYDQRDPLHTLSHYVLPDTDYMSREPESQQKRKEEIDLIMQHALEWFDAIKKAEPQKDSSFDWEHQKGLAMRRANYASRKNKGPSTVRGPWQYEDEKKARRSQYL